VKSILENGLRLGKRGGYGAGIYFADMVCKSCRYTDYRLWSAKEGRVGYLFLNDVLLGNSYKAYPWKTSLRKPPPMNVSPWWKIWGEQRFVPTQSVRGIGTYGEFGPCSSGNVVVDGCTWPLGYAWGMGPWSGFNEYVIYDAKQVKPKFLITFVYKAIKVV